MENLVDISEPHVPPFAYSGFNVRKAVSPIQTE